MSTKGKAKPAKVATPETDLERRARERRERIAAEAPALQLTGQGVAIMNPGRDDVTVADLLVFMSDAGHHPIDVLKNVVEGHLAELAILQRMVCGKDEDRTAGADEDRFYYFFEHMRARLEAAIVLDERIKAANAEVRP